MCVCRQSDELLIERILELEETLADIGRKVEATELENHELEAENEFLEKYINHIILNPKGNTVSTPKGAKSCSFAPMGHMRSIKVSQHIGELVRPTSERQFTLKGVVPNNEQC
eukprot:Platyproteum_vivax@DN754_c0_g1_i1.p1